MQLWRFVFLAYFVSHIPITLLVDAQGLFGDRYPQVLKDVLAWYLDLFKDPMMQHPVPLWFASFVVCEIFVQLPFFFYAAYSLWKGLNSFRIPAIVYGAHVCTTMVPILSTLLFHDDLPAMSRTLLFSVYLPYLLVPAWIMVHFWLHPRPFSAEAAKATDKKRS